MNRVVLLCTSCAWVDYHMKLVTGQGFFCPDKVFQPLQSLFFLRLARLGRAPWPDSSAGASLLIRALGLPPLSSTLFGIGSTVGCCTRLMGSTGVSSSSSASTWLPRTTSTSAGLQKDELPATCLSTVLTIIIDHFLLSRSSRCCSWNVYGVVSAVPNHQRPWLMVLREIHNQ